MHRKTVFPAFSLALAALFAGCEWTGTSSSDSWSGSYDAMNFSGTYRSTSTLVNGTETVTVSTQTSGNESSNTSTTTEESGGTVLGAPRTTKETVGTYKSGTYRYSGTLSHSPVVLDSVQIQLGGITFTGDVDGSGNLVSDYGAGKVTSSGAWSVDVTAASTATTDPSTTGGHATKVSNETLGNVSSTGKFSASTKNHPLVPGSVTINFDNGMSFSDDGNGNLKSSVTGAGGSIEYTGGGITLDWSSTAANWKNYSGTVRATYSYYSNVTSPGSTTTTASPLKGSGPIVAVYSYTTPDSTSPSSTTTTSTTSSPSSSTTTTTTTTTSGEYPIAASSSKITAITVSQSGQNLVMTTNTGIQMSGKFTAVRETSSTSDDSNDSGKSTYNAQFQVSSGAGHKFVGTLNHDLVTRHCTLNGTLTYGRATYDVQGVGPAFSASATTTTTN